MLHIKVFSHVYCRICKEVFLTLQVMEGYGFGVVGTLYYFEVAKPSADTFITGILSAIILDISAKCLISYTRVL